MVHIMQKKNIEEKKISGFISKRVLVFLHSLMTYSHINFIFTEISKFMDILLKKSKKPLQE